MPLSWVATLSSLLLRLTAWRFGSGKVHSIVIISSWQGVKDPAKLRVACGAKNMSLTSPSYLDNAEVRLQVSEIVRHPGYRDPAIVVDKAGVTLHRLEVDVL